MFEVVPKYYQIFKCKADKCSHTCCEGWEIQISAKTYKKYMHVKGELCKRLKNNICKKKDGYYFKQIDGRCPFLDSNGLCVIIREIGEDYLSDICKMHPRFINEFEYHTEIGLGMCCEEATDIILNNSLELVLMSDGNCCNIELQKFYYNYSGWEKELFDIREAVLSIVQDKSKKYHDIKKDLSNIVGDIDLNYDINKVLLYFLDLEIMQPQWKHIISQAINDKSCEFTYESPYNRNLLSYFIFRYSCKARNLIELKKYLFFSLLSTDVICGIIKKLSCDQDEAKDVCRMYSQEIEYSTVNVDLIIKRFYIQ